MRKKERGIYLRERRVSLCFAFHHLCAETILGPLFCQWPCSNRNPVLISLPGGRRALLQFPPSLLCGLGRASGAGASGPSAALTPQTALGDGDPDAVAGFGRGHMVPRAGHRA